MQFSLIVQLDGAAFSDDEAVTGAFELARILEQLGRQLADAGEPIGTTDRGSVRDVNGNTCGRWAIGEPGIEHARATPSDVDGADRRHADRRAEIPPTAPVGLSWLASWDNLTADHVAPALTCSEVDELAELARVAGRPDLAAQLWETHERTDDADEGDRHAPARPPCRACGTLLDADGYCVDVGCRYCGKTGPTELEVGADEL